MFGNVCGESDEGAAAAAAATDAASETDGNNDVSDSFFPRRPRNSLPGKKSWAEDGDIKPSALTAFPSCSVLLHSRREKRSSDTREASSGSERYHTELKSLFIYHGLSVSRKERAKNLVSTERAASAATAASPTLINSPTPPPAGPPAPLLASVGFLP